MKKTFSIILLGYLIAFLVVGPSAWATDYYGGAAGKNLNANDLWYEAVSGNCTGSGSPVASATVLQAGNTLYANGCTIAITDSFTATKISTELGGAANAVAGGGFTLATGTVSGKTFTTITQAGTTPCVTISGNGAGTPVDTFAGKVIGGSASVAYGISSTHTVGTIRVSEDVDGGTNTTAEGVHWSGANGSFDLTKTATGKTAPAISITSTGTVTVVNCVGSDTANIAGCQALSTGAITSTGNIINGARGVGAVGTITWAPASALNYVAYTVGTDRFASIPPANTNVKAGVQYVDPADGTTETGTLAGGGGAWAF